MPEWLQQTFPHAADVTIDVLLIRLGMALVLGGVIAAIYRWTQREEGVVEPGFIATLVLLCILIAMLTHVVGDSVSRAFSLAGVLAIVRFRTVVTDTRDTAFVIFSVIVGMSLGVGKLPVALAGMGVVGSAAILLRFFPRPMVQEDAGWTLQIRVASVPAGPTPWDPIFAKHLLQANLDSTATARQGAAIDLSFRVHIKPSTTPLLFLGDLNRLEGVQNLELRRK